MTRTSCKFHYFICLTLLALAGCVAGTGNYDSAVARQGQSLTVAVGPDQVQTLQVPVFANPGSFGVLTPDSGGFEDAIWQGVEPDLARSLPFTPPVKAGKALFVKMLLSEAVPPEGLGAAWLNRRIDTLLAMNERQASLRLSYQSLRGRNASHDEYIRIVQLLMEADRKEEACLEVLGSQQQGADWQVLHSICLAVSGQKKKAIDTLHQVNGQEEAVAYLDALYKGEAKDLPEQNDLRTALAFARNRLTKQNASVPMPLSVQELMDNARNKRLFVAVEESDLQQAADAGQKGRVLLLSYALLHELALRDEKPSPEIMDALVDAWKKQGWSSEADNLRAELTR